MTAPIREYERDDFEQLYKIDHAAFSDDIAYSRLELQYYLQSRKCRTLVSEEGGEIVGFVVGCSELCGPLRALRKRNPLEKERYVGAKLAKDRKARKADVNP